eukprot:g10059.t1
MSTSMCRRMQVFQVLCLLSINHSDAVSHVSGTDSNAVEEVHDGAGRKGTSSAWSSSARIAAKAGDVDCQWDDWVDWSVCQFSCGGGQSVRTRKVKIMAQGNGVACDNNDKETRVCNKNPCPLDCVWDEWSSWGACSVSCGSGVKAATLVFN